MASRTSREARRRLNISQRKISAGLFGEVTFQHDGREAGGTSSNQTGRKKKYVGKTEKRAKIKTLGKSLR